LCCAALVGDIDGGGGDNVGNGGGNVAQNVDGGVYVPPPPEPMMQNPYQPNVDWNTLQSGAQDQVQG
jgi:hypothetical protein